MNYFSTRAFFHIWILSCRLTSSTLFCKCEGESVVFLFFYNTVSRKFFTRKISFSVQLLMIPSQFQQENKLSSLRKWDKLFTEVCLHHISEKTVAPFAKMFSLEKEMHTNIWQKFIQLHCSLDITLFNTTLFGIQSCFFLGPQIIFKKSPLGSADIGNSSIFAQFQWNCNWKYWIYINIVTF